MAITAQKKQKAIELGLSLMKHGDSIRREFLESQTVLNRTQAAGVIGCRPRDLHNHLKPDFYLSGPKYKIASVLAKQNELIARSAPIIGS